VVQRVSSASVAVDGSVAGEIRHGMLVLLGVGQGDDEGDADHLAEKIVNLRIFSDEGGVMNSSVLDSGGSVLVVSQFTLYGDCRKGRRPSYAGAAASEDAQRLYEYFCERVRGFGLTLATGVFRATMDVSLVNDGPVTLLLDSRKTF
jgi:D-tyrosyl-tRNA(Tyr) deacylase